MFGNILHCGISAKYGKIFQKYASSQLNSIWDFLRFDMIFCCRCDGCNAQPVIGPRYKCTVCEEFDFCENCFKTRRFHKHPFNKLTEPGGPAVYAGRPGKFKKKTLGVAVGNGVIEDWHRCVKHLSVSSRDGQAHRLIYGSGGYWQSSGSQGKVRIVI